MSRRKKHEEEHENHERWLVSYADFITLLFAFFVVMYAVSRVDNKRLIQAANSIKWALHFSGTGGVGQMPIFEGPPSQGGTVAGTAGGPLSQEQQQEVENFRRQLENRVRALVMPQDGKTAVTITAEGSTVKVRMAAADFFDAGQAVIRPHVLPVLDALADEIVPLGRPLHVEGHTDETPASGRFRDNWDLSAARAATVASYLERAHHARPELLVASGFASSRPVARGTSQEAREANRRVELVIELVPPDDGRPESPGMKAAPADLVRRGRP
jgi:chemotaxis protein MotB